jgi:hypothetical protein
MHKQEIQILTKIIRELSFFFITHNHTHFTIETDLNNNNSILIVTLENAKQSLIDYIVEHLKDERELSTETYGWELIGEIDSESEFELLGTMIDDVLVTKNDNKTILRIIRQSHYKS